MKLHVFLFILGLILFKASLDLSYYLILSVDYRYVGYDLNFYFIRYIISWIIYISSFLILSSKLIYVKDYYFLTAVVGVICPILVIWGMDSQRSSFAVYVTYLCVALTFLSYHLFWRLKSLRIPYFNHGENLAFIISVIFVMYLVIWYPISGVTYNLDFSRVYEFRRVNESLSSSGILAYFNVWTFKVFSVFLLAYSLLNKKYFLSITMICVFILFFAANGHKSVLFYPLLVIGIWWLFSNKNKLFIVPIGLSLIVFFSIISYIFLNDVWLTSLIPNRVFEIPAHLTFKYFDFFKENDYLYFSNSFLSNYMEYPYNLSLPKLIADYDDKPWSSANNGYISSGFAQGGVFIPMIYSIIIGFILCVIDKMINKGELKLWFALALLVVPIRDFLISIDFLTTLLTGGLFLSVFLLILSRKKNFN